MRWGNQHPNIKGIFCTDALGGVGAATAIKEANKVGKVKIVSFDTDKETLDLIKQGVIDKYLHTHIRDFSH